MSSHKSPADQAVQLYQEYLKLLEGNHHTLLGSLQNFVGHARRKVEAMSKESDEQKLSMLDKNLNEV